MHPDYEYVLWDKQSLSSFIHLTFSELHDDWVKLDKPIKQCDCARYLLLYHFGGVYADLDTLPYKCMDDIWSNLAPAETNIVLSEESHDPLAWKAQLLRDLALERNNTVIVGNAIMLSKPKKDFWLQFVNAAMAVRERPVLDSFSTWHLTNFVKNRESISDCAILPSDHLLQTTYSGVDTYAVHKYDATWFNHGAARPWEG